MSVDVVRIGKAIFFSTRPFAYFKHPENHPENGAAPQRAAAEPPMMTPAAMAADHACLVEALQKRIADLETRNEELEAFSHTVAHALQGPLSLIIGFSKILEENSATMSEEELRDFLDMIARSGRKLSDLIDELLLLAGSRQRAVAAEPLDMASIVSEAQQCLAPMIEDHGAQLVLPASWPQVLGYAPWIEEVWVNYLSNAIKYGGQPSRVEVGFDKETNQPINQSTNQKTASASHIRFWVRDNGPGISPDDQRRLFTTFTRLGMIPAAGHGLGLAIVRQIVEKLGGQVGVESNGSGGSLFSFTLPEA
jgi:two-component system, sensor histidine kinase and response regulator